MAVLMRRFDVVEYAAAVLITTVLVWLAGLAATH